MRAKNDTRAATAEHSAKATVAPRFTRAAEAERSRLEGRRQQLVNKRETFQEEIRHIDRAIGAVDELLGMLTPLLAANCGEPEAAPDGGRAQAERGGSGSEAGAGHGRELAAR